MRPAAQSLSLSRQRKEPKKGDPKSATPSLRCGADLRREACWVRRRTHCALRAAFRQPRRVSLRSACMLRCTRHPASPAPQAQPEGGWTAEQPTAEQPHGPLLRSAPSRGRKRHALRRLGRATRWPEWMFAGFPSVRAEKRRAGGGCVCRRTHALRALTCRSCLNGARSAQ